MGGTEGMKHNPTQKLGGNRKKEDVADAVKGYENYHTSFGGSVEERKAQYADMVNRYYDLATSFYEYGWCVWSPPMESMSFGGEGYETSCGRMGARWRVFWVRMDGTRHPRAVRGRRASAVATLDGVDLDCVGAAIGARGHRPQASHSEMQYIRMVEPHPRVMLAALPPSARSPPRFPPSQG
jgi:hypothetical protein